MSNETQLRIIENLHSVPEHSFFSESVQTVIDELHSINTLKELIDKSTDTYQQRVKNLFHEVAKRDDLKYQAFLSRINKLENTFSYDVDYI